MTGSAQSRRRRPRLPGRLERTAALARAVHGRGVYLVAEVIGGLLTGSLALIADSGHLLTDVLGLAMALAAIRFARRPATPGKTYGFYRAEILAALINSVILIGVAVWIFVAAWARLQAPTEVHALPMLLVAAGGLVVTVVGARLLHAGSRESLNVRGAFLELIGDLLGAIGTIGAALVILFTGWTLADPLISAAIGLLILPRAWSLLHSVVDVLLESTPHHSTICTSGPSPAASMPCPGTCGPTADAPKTCCMICDASSKIALGSST
jgi:cobalt-zinc-cadmium efflux system protein